MATNIKTIHGPARRVVGETTVIGYQGCVIPAVVLECGHDIVKITADKTRTPSGRVRCWHCRNGEKS